MLFYITLTRSDLCLILIFWVFHCLISHLNYIFKLICFIKYTWHMIYLFRPCKLPSAAYFTLIHQYLVVLQLLSAIFIIMYILHFNILYTPLSLLLQFEYFASSLISFNFVLKMISKSILQFTIIIICHLFVFVCFFITIRIIKIVLFNFP